MIRPFTCLAFLLACGSGLYLYQSKHRVRLLDDQIAQTVHSTDALHEQTRMLSAEWTLLNDPERLRQLASQFLTLQTVSPNQFTSLAELDSRLPAPVAPTPPGAAAPDDQSSVPVAANDANTPGEDAGKPGAAKGAASASAAPRETAVGSKDSSMVRVAVTSSLADAVHGPVADAAHGPVVHAVERKPEISHVAAVTLAPRNLSRPIEQRAPEPRVYEQRVAETRPLMVAPRAPARMPLAPVAMQSSGSLLGMAHGVGSSSAPLPLPRPMPVTAPNWTYTNGG